MQSEGMRILDPNEELRKIPCERYTVKISVLLDKTIFIGHGLFGVF